MTTGTETEKIFSNVDKEAILEQSLKDIESSDFRTLSKREAGFRKCLEEYFSEKDLTDFEKSILKNREDKIEDFLKTDFILLKDKYENQEELEGLLLSFIYDFLRADDLVIFLVKLESKLETSKLLISICKKMLLDKNKIFAFYAKRTLESMIYMMNYHVIQDEELINHEHYGDRIADIKLRSRRNSIARTPDRYCYKGSGKN